MLAANQAVSLGKKHTLKSKWNILFERSPEWISFKPQPGLKVYPCYACRNMFSSKASFQDHINRRIIIIKYKCNQCTTTLTFYNRCAFLLHTRKHYTMREGHVHLTNVDIHHLPIELAGFDPHENVPFLYNDEDDLVKNNRREKDKENEYINTQFYTPDADEIGKQIITVKPYNLAFHYTENTKSVLLGLKQIATNTPLCEFVDHENCPKPPQNNDVIESVTNETNQNPVRVDLNCVKQERIDEEEIKIPVISKIESLSNVTGIKINKKKAPICTECGEGQLKSLAQHFVGQNKPLDAKIQCNICKYIAPTKCSLSAHVRTHNSSKTRAPYVCPECGRQYPNIGSLNQHMDDTCFHLTKQVRYRCPALKCGKLFVVYGTFATHFANAHVLEMLQCSECQQIFNNNDTENGGSGNENDFNTHECSIKNKNSVAIRVNNCTVCKCVKKMSETERVAHISQHVSDRERCVYIYTCKSCRNSFRSTTTYAVHKVKCVKIDKGGTVTIGNINSINSNNNVGSSAGNYNSTNLRNNNNNLNNVTSKSIFKFFHCHNCAQKLVFRDRDRFRVCSICKQVNYLVQNSSGELCTSSSNINYYSTNLKRAICILCKESVAEMDKKGHSKTCKYNNPVVNLTKLPSNMTLQDISLLITNTNNESSDESRSSSRKRRKFLKTTVKTVIKNDLQAEAPIQFTGVYTCKLCDDFKTPNRVTFHEHIITHRNVSTSYQCMECGLCFMVKPSLTKHLTHFHKINDIDTYLAQNVCVDKEAIAALEENLKRPGGSGNGSVGGWKKGPLEPNQCGVCWKQCEDEMALSAHFRVHGMAFLKKNNSNNVSVTM